MLRRVALASIRAVHTLIFAIVLACIEWLVWTGAAGRRDRTVGWRQGSSRPRRPSGSRTIASVPSHRWQRTSAPNADRGRLVLVTR